MYMFMLLSSPCSRQRSVVDQERGGAESLLQDNKAGGGAGRERGGVADGGKEIALRAVCCSALTQLVLNDANAQLIVQVQLWVQLI